MQTHPATSLTKVTPKPRATTTCVFEKILFCHFLYLPWTIDICLVFSTCGNLIEPSANGPTCFMSFLDDHKMHFTSLFHLINIQRDPASVRILASSTHFAFTVMNMCTWSVNSANVAIFRCCSEIHYSI